MIETYVFLSWLNASIKFAFLKIQYQGEQVSPILYFTGVISMNSREAMTENEQLNKV